MPLNSSQTAENRASAAGKTVNQAELALLFGVSVVTLRSWERMGMPVAEKGGSGRAYTYDTAAVLRWREQQLLASAFGDAKAIDFEEAKRRKMVAEAKLAEIEHDRQVGLVVLVEDALAGVMAEYTIVRNKLLGLGAKIAPRVFALRSPEEAKAVIDREVFQALEELTDDGNAPAPSRQP